ncbi:MAG: type II secretion system protein GspF [Desulfuromonas sp.]|uniref:type II secretion system inner membrane protein GspF n=1 Tax=Desulfuromonas sp. TaxID=892 RepID=UPI000CAAD1EA|nr:type II secretion system inner membrane protein GspF [Desulfuromonas sp.]PLX85320.1 MAG: type II secretion system protein GspF [Desulfuromonas sp.]
MALFEYSGLNAGGKKVSGVVEATGKRAVLQKLRGQGIYPTELREQNAAAAGKPSLSGLSLTRKVPTAELAAATRQLSTLLGAGLPLDEALATVGGQLENAALAHAIGQVREDVVQGESFNAALAKFPRIFAPLYVNMVQVGENSGTLDQVLQRLADFQEEQARMKSRIRAATAYPILMAVVGVGVLFFMFAFVVPKVTRMLEDLGQALPLPTRLLIGASDLLMSTWWVLVLLLAAAAIATLRYVRTERGREKLDRLALRLPLFGKLNLLIATSRFARTLGTLLQSGVPLLGALDIAKNLLQNRVLFNAIEETAVCVREGEGLAAPLKRSGVFPPMVAQMAAVGEKSGEMEQMLFRVAESYEHQVDLSITAMLSLLEPLMILLMGSVVGFIVMAILLPIFQASQGMG